METDKKEGTGGTSQEKLEEIFTALDNLLGKRTAMRFDYDSPSDSGLQFIIQRGKTAHLV